MVKALPAVDKFGWLSSRLRAEGEKQRGAKYEVAKLFANTGTRFSLVVAVKDKGGMLKALEFQRSQAEADTP